MYEKLKYCDGRFHGAHLGNVMEPLVSPRSADHQLNSLKRLFKTDWSIQTHFSWHRLLCTANRKCILMFFD